MFILPKLPYKYNALEPYIDEETMRIHHTKHHAAYVKNVNDALGTKTELLSRSIEEILAMIPQIPQAIREKVRNNGGGHANHSFFWKTMTGEKGSTPSEELNQAFTDAFGGMEKMRERFASAALGRFGSGWAWIIVKNGRMLDSIDTPNQDNPWMEGNVPILGIDVWEHAYYLKYRNRRAEYIEAWWNVINWQQVSERFHNAVKLR